MFLHNGSTNVEDGKNEVEGLIYGAIDLLFTYMCAIYILCGHSLNVQFL